LILAHHFSSNHCLMNLTWKEWRIKTSFFFRLNHRHLFRYAKHLTMAWFLLIILSPIAASRICFEKNEE
jgi:hypothetical protein